ncbi:MAG: hybrid sensor histidine kinase/response regulator, partial [Pseudobutyrivibrio sp.]|nr:hybrid sensor histidine kinase/response regulator [Pseudobutyrivibrio sp.]
AVTGQIGNVGTSCKVYDASNGLPTSDANYILGSSSGYMYVGGYSGVLKYDGTGFERINAEDGLTSGRCFFEDSKGRIWVGTNDNGIVCLDNLTQTHFHAKDGMPSLCVRAFAEDNKGRIIVGTASGLVYIDNDMNVVRIDEKRLNQSLITRLSTDSRGVVYGYSTSGYVFSIESGKVQEIFKGIEKEMENISYVFADPKSSGRVYFGTYNGLLYYGKFGDSSENLKVIDIYPIEDVRWISYDCERIWVASSNYVGYLDQNNRFMLVRNIPFNTDIEMLTSDYQGNIWIASSTMGIMKLVSNNFYNVSENSPISNMVVYCTQFYKNKMYIGAEDGLFIVRGDGTFETDELTKAVGNARVRHIFVDSKNNIWIATYENNVGLLCQKPDGEILSYTKDTGISTNLIRCITETENGTIVVGTSKGLNYIKDYKISHPVDIAKELRETVVLSLIEKDGEIYAGTSGEGIYIISDRGVRQLGLDKGLTSDIVMRVKWDEQREVMWLITSNSIQYIKNDIIANVSSFPYNNCYELFFDHDSDEIWVLASNGIYCAKGQEMLDDRVKNYKQYNLQNGLPAMPTANAYSQIDNNGDMYLASRKGVFRFNIDNFVEEKIFTIIAVNKVMCDGHEVFVDKNGEYVLPAGTKRVSFVPAILDYSESNPLVRMSLGGMEDEGVTLSLNDMKPLEYTGIKYGDYYLRIDLLNSSGDQVIQSKRFAVRKTPRFFEMLLV